MTDLLYYKDAYLKELDTKVVSSNEDGVILEQTIFYPGGGGQKPDTGYITWSKNGNTLQATISNTKKVGNEILHVLNEGSPHPEPGTETHLVLDWERRYLMMRVHTSLHLLSAVIWQEYGVQVTGGDIKPGTGKLDFDFEHRLDPETKMHIESKVQELIDADLPVSARVLPREEAFQIPDLIRTKINLLPESLKEIRVVEIEGADLQADGGLHVKHTKEIGTFKIVKSKNKGKGRKRLEIAVE